jgi:hypothetical protein
MFSAEQYRAKAAEYAALLANISCSPNETSEFRNLQQTYTTLAENEEWMAINVDKTVQRRRNGDDRTGLDEDEERILRCVATAAVMQRKTGPTMLQLQLAGGPNLSMLPQTAEGTAVVAEQ